MAQPKRKNILPGFGLSMGYTVTYLSLLVLIPLGWLVIRGLGHSPREIWTTLTDPVVTASFKLTLWASAVAAVISSVFGFVIAWTLVRYKFPGKRFFDAIVDLPFALPTAVAGLSFSNLYLPHGWIGRVGIWLGETWAWGPISAVWNGFAWLMNHSLVWLLEKLANVLIWLVNLPLKLTDFQVDKVTWEIGKATPDFLALSNTNMGIVIVLIFVGFPFVVRTIQPVLQEWQTENEQAAASLGAGRWTTFRRVIWPEIRPAFLTGLSLAFARAVGEYGSVIFIAANRPGESQIVPLQIITKLFESDTYAKAHIIAAALLLISLLVILTVNIIEWRGRKQAVED